MSVTFILAWLITAGTAQAHEVIDLGPSNATITGSIAYSELGTYQARFNDFQGRLILNGQDVEAVDLKIKVKSIQSDCSFCDRAACSRHGLHAYKFPWITFESKRITHEGDHYQVFGVLQMHGIAHRLVFPFTVSHLHGFELHGHWRIDRKSFGIVWNRILDNGGVLIGDYFTVDWGIHL